ncbi:MAG: response regulator [Thermodesulfobacterium sp.]|uniref:CheY-like RECdomain n=1 Tax=Candidatus Thermodesulfobacterium syntrophicum TaxID=3060442 RepID=A0AAE3TEY9_9BACT|nr:response regulator [Thermodesulfobacterium hydrogeniphilum]MBO8143673.1 response regulator [Thermodesulfobacterium sp.]MDF2953966.1 CheY-like RECdomain [Candidatus Thermodesulfobacterium syntrophicum]
MGKKILIVDDAASMRGLVAMTLKKSGYEVVEASDGKDALTKLSSVGKVDLIITDLNMPNMDGIELIKTLKADMKYRFIPVIMLTTESQEAKKEEGRKAGAKAWIVKPFKPDVLVSVVKKIIG